MNNLFDIFSKIDSNKNIIKQKDNLILNQTTDAYNMMYIAASFMQTEDVVFVVLPNIYMAQQYYDGLSNIVGTSEVLFYPADEILSSLMALSSQEFKIERIYTLGTLINKAKKIVVTNLNGAIKKQLGKSDWIEATRKNSSRP